MGIMIFTNFLLPIVGSLLQLLPPRRHLGLVQVVGLVVGDPPGLGAVPPRVHGDREPQRGQIPRPEVILVASPVPNFPALAVPLLDHSALVVPLHEPAPLLDFVGHF